MYVKYIMKYFIKVVHDYMQFLVIFVKHFRKLLVSKLQRCVFSDIVFDVLVLSFFSLRIPGLKSEPDTGLCFGSKVTLHALIKMF